MLPVPANGAPVTINPGVYAAPAAEKKAAPAAEKAKKEPSEKQKAQQERMKGCNDKAADKKGDERKKFMSSCLKGEDDGASDKQKAQQNKMSSCNKEAGEKNMKGEVLHPGGSHHPSPHLQQPVAAPLKPPTEIYPRWKAA